MKRAFVYKWVNLTNGKYYIGYHLGSIDDGYVSSSHNNEFWSDFYNPKMKWRRDILFTGTTNECLAKEQSLLREENLSSQLIYNNAVGATIIFTQDVLRKMSDSAKNRWANMSVEQRKRRNEKISNSKRGFKHTENTKQKLRENLIGKTFVERFGNDRAGEIGKKISESNTGKQRHSAEHRSSLSDRMIGNRFGASISDDVRKRKRERWLAENNPNFGKPLSDDTKKKISAAKSGVPSKFKNKPRLQIKCNHCDTIGGVGVMNRWHFDNCKHRNDICQAKTE